MGRNVEIKARIQGRWDEVEKRAVELADSGPFVLEQEDVFYFVPRGRLKLRTENGRSELILYARADESGPKVSSYLCLDVPDVEAAKKLLKEIHGERGVVRKRRVLYLAGRTRIHLDRVEGLGEFLELEVVMGDDQVLDEGTVTARELMGRLGIGPEHLLDRAYIDLMSD